MIILGLKVQNPPPDFVYQPLNPAYGGKATVIRPLADFLHAYQLDGGYTPGPLYLAATVLGLARHAQPDPPPQAPLPGRGRPRAGSGLLPVLPVRGRDPAVL